MTSIPGVVGYSEPHFWENSSEKFVGTLRVQVRGQAPPGATPHRPRGGRGWPDPPGACVWPPRRRPPQVTHDTDEQRTRMLVASIFKKLGVHNFVVQIEKTA